MEISFVLKLHLGGPAFVENVNISPKSKVAYPSDVADSQVDSEMNLNASEMDGNCKESEVFILFVQNSNVFESNAEHIIEGSYRGSHSDFSGPTSRSTTCIAIVLNNHVVVANAGDYHCMISRKGE
ncbi:hypothetical protein IFM89_003151, partial [Coptis chinensis]